MKKYLLSILAAVSPFIVFGRQLTADEALSRAVDHTRACMPGLSVKAYDLSQPVYTSSADGINQFYVFNAYAGQGYVIVAADDCAAPVLGYSDNGSFDADNMPQNLKWWLSQYQTEINFAISRNTTYVRLNAPKRDDIEPMLNTKWDQIKPYNNMCPEFDGKRCVTGCGATAMAQVMNYHKWPIKGKGQKEYTWNGSTLSLDFSEITFDWENMLNTYDSSSPKAACDAVAQLMYACGVATETFYSTSSSSTSTVLLPAALIDYFDYDKGALLVRRNFYTTRQWEDIIYGEMAASRPVLYGGMTVSKEGHEFVCDGYKDGYFHINWGWSGVSNGYFLLSALNPDNQGVGGSEGAFSLEQDAVIGIQKPKPQSEYATYVGIMGNFGTFTNVYSRTSKVLFTSDNSAFFNLSPQQIEIYYGVKLIDSSNTVYCYAADKPVTIPANKGYNTYQVNMATVPDGHYTVSPAYMTTDGVWHDIYVYNGYVKQLSLDATAESLTFTPIYIDADIKVVDFSLESPLYGNRYFKATATLSAESEFSTKVCVAMYDSDSDTPRLYGDEVYISLIPGEEYHLNYISKFVKYNTTLGMPESGNYRLLLVDANLNPLSSPIDVYYEAEAAATSINMYDFAIATGKTAPINDINVKGTLKCNKGYFANNFTVHIFPGEGGYSIANFSSPFYFLSDGESVDFNIHFKFTDGEVGKKYIMCPYLGSTPLSSNIYFTLTDAVPDGITDADMESIDIIAAGLTVNICGLPSGQEICITDISGMNFYQGCRHTVTLPTAGVYIVTAGGKRTKILVR